jgi:hypothetical protein
VLAYVEKKFFHGVFLPVFNAISKEKKINLETATDNESGYNYFRNVHYVRNILEQWKIFVFFVK